MAVPTARFLISVSGTHPNPCRIERALKTESEDRAVLSAQKWLIDVDKTCRWFGVVLDHYEIYKQDGFGNWYLWKGGDLTDAQMGRAGARQARGKTTRTSNPSKDPSGSTSTRKRSKKQSRTTTTRTNSAFGYTTASTGRRVDTSFKARIKEATLIAKQRLAEEQQKTGR